MSPANSLQSNGRALAQARRKAMSGSGKAMGADSSTRTEVPKSQVNVASNDSIPGVLEKVAATVSNGRSASVARRRSLSKSGKSGAISSDRIRTLEKNQKAETGNPEGENFVTVTPDCGCGCNESKNESSTVALEAGITPVKVSRNLVTRKPKKLVNSSSCRAGSLARRKAMSSRGKAGISKNGMSQAQTARATNPDLNGRELAKALRDQNSKVGKAGQKKSEPTRPMRPSRNSPNGAAQDASWKVGASDTSHGQTVTGTLVGRSESVTGDEASTCRDVTGTEYMGADIFQHFCQAELAPSIRRSGVSSTGLGNAITGNQVGRSQKVTGEEPGSCKNVTGMEYVGIEQQAKFCGKNESPIKSAMAEKATRKGNAVSGDNVGRSEKVTGDEVGMSRELTGTQYTRPEDIGHAISKAARSTTLRGTSVTGTRLGRRDNMTGDEPGSCRNVTGDEYVDQEQFSSYCESSPQPADSKVGVSSTFKGNSVTGTMTGRSGVVTGNEPGVCKSVTGTPYAGLDQANDYCDASATQNMQARIPASTEKSNSRLTGQQSGVGGQVTGGSRGASEEVTGTPFTGSDQSSDISPSTAANTASPDFPQLMIGVMKDKNSAPSQSVPDKAMSTAVTGNRYSIRQDITGPFGKADGKITGTEEARFGSKMQIGEVASSFQQDNDSREKSRITGEGQDSGLKITGDDWDRNEQVTGTEGRSATLRNPTIRMGISKGIQVEQKRNEDIPLPNSKVTGGSGNTEKGSLITYSGGARG